MIARGPMRLPATIACTIAVLTPAVAAAQPTPWTDRGYVAINGFYQSTSSFSDLVRPVQGGEAAQIDTSYGVAGMPGFDAGAGVRLWRNLALGVDAGYASTSKHASVTAQVPHPFYFNRPRPVSGDTTGLSRSETAINVEALLMVPIRARWQAAVFGGPTWFMVDQDLVTNVTVSESYPFDTATFAGATVVRQSHSAAGFNVGGDLSYILRPHVGVGFDVRYSRATVALTGSATVVAGGSHVGGGIRFRF